MRDMAIERNEATSKIILKVAVGTGANGAVAYGQRTYNRVNPELSDEDVLALGQALGKLQMYAVSNVSSQDAAALQQA